MKFLVDAQLPRRLVPLLQQAGHDALHTLDLPLGNRTPDTTVNEITDHDQRVVITQDADFVNSFLLLGTPHKLLLVSTGNISNNALFEMFTAHLPLISRELEPHSYLELNRTALIVHR